MLGHNTLCLAHSAHCAERPELDLLVETCMRGLVDTFSYQMTPCTSQSRLSDTVRSNVLFAGNEEALSRADELQSYPSASKSVFPAEKNVDVCHVSFQPSDAFQ